VRFATAIGRPVHGRRPSRGVRPPKCCARRAAGATPTGACHRSRGCRQLVARVMPVRAAGSTPRHPGPHRIRGP
jgi:hypothetical protein